MMATTVASIDVALSHPRKSIIRHAHTKMSIILVLRGGGGGSQRSSKLYRCYFDLMTGLGGCEDRPGIVTVLLRGMIALRDGTGSRRTLHITV